MIISDINEYLFIAIPRTGSTTISSELIKHYQGREILEKHSNYYEFLKIANKKQKQYFVFATVRNPLDEIVSFYEKLRHPESSSLPDLESTKRLKLLSNYVNKPNHTFFGFLKKSFPFISSIELNAKYCDFVMRFENLQEDFKKVLKKIGLQKVRDLPTLNKTKKETDHFSKYYKNEEILKLSAKMFAPFMEKWGYQFPDKRFSNYITSSDRIKYIILQKIRYLHSKMSNMGLQKIINLYWSFSDRVSNNQTIRQVLLKY